MQVKLERILLGLGAIAVILLGIVITANVTARAVFGTAVPDSVTMVRELMVAAILLPLAAATAARAHVCVAFISDRFGPRLRSGLIVLGSFMGLIALAPLIYAGWREFIDVVESGSFFYGDLNLPKWPGRLLFVIGIVACWLRLAELVVRDTRTILRGGEVSDEQDHEMTAGGFD
ncbi:TRAP transporter small permease [Sulfitobacter sabulilitoris]|uniref:TRAP transporter small permease protein n=1 Tax=Sulfitobacter sabulilitoris TaxID=2562655 RepID=A0A5S3PC38_9RHOB|nr:TRAP transporter small permease subunit [Sulfitobacter sabulilitoris]TMM51262.1 TRAP transporter small permease subunit [Sulfitobacter sabulilitoris]